jgi:hypothetical protein
MRGYGTRHCDGNETTPSSARQVGTQIQCVAVPWWPRGNDMDHERSESRAVGRLRCAAFLAAATVTG